MWFNRRELLAWVAMGTGGALLACVPEFTGGSAYEDEVFLCGPSHADAFAARVKECRERPGGGRCYGIVSLEGTLQGVPVRSTMEIVTSTFYFVQADNGVVSLAHVQTSGPTPYFQLTLELISLGKLVAQDRVLRLDPSASSAAADLADDVAFMALRLSAGGQSESFGALRDSGTLELKMQTFSEVVGAFSGRYAHQEDQVAGCFQVFEQNTLLKQE